MVKIQTQLNPQEYSQFKSKAKSLGITEYALAKEGILLVIEEPIVNTRARRVLRTALAFFESGQAIP